MRRGRPGDVGAAVLLLLACAAVAAREAPAEKPQDRTTAIRQKYAKTPAAGLKIAEPVEVKDVFYWKDGGSIGLVLADANGKEHKLCMDGRLPVGKDRPAGPFPLVLGVTHPSKPGGTRVAVRGPEEAAVYGLLLRWANRHPQREYLLDESKEEVPASAPRNLWEVRTFLLRLDRRYTEAGAQAP